MTKQETDNHNLVCLEKYMLETGVKPEDFDTLPFGEDEPIETEYYHTKEAATAHLAGVGLNFSDYLRWSLENKHIQVFPGAVIKDISHSASSLRQYIREHNTL